MSRMKKSRDKKPADTTWDLGNTLPASVYKKQFTGYRFKIKWYASKPFDPENEAVDVVLQIRNGQEYWSNFTTPKFLKYMFKKNSRTGECAGGTYFCLPGMVVVRRIDKESISKTINDLIEDQVVSKYFL